MVLVESFHSVSADSVAPDKPIALQSFDGGAAASASGLELLTDAKQFDAVITSRMINPSPQAPFDGLGPVAFVPFPAGENYSIGHGELLSVTRDGSPLTIGGAAREVPWRQAPPSGALPQHVRRADVFGHMVAILSPVVGQSISVSYCNRCIVVPPRVGLCATTSDGSAVDFSGTRWQPSTFGTASFDSILWNKPPRPGCDLLVYRKTKRRGGRVTTTKDYDNYGYGYLPYCVIDGDRGFCAGSKMFSGNHVGFIISDRRRTQSFRFAWFDPTTGARGCPGPHRVSWNASLTDVRIAFHGLTIEE